MVMVFMVPYPAYRTESAMAASTVAIRRYDATRESFIRAIPASAAPISAPERTTFTTAAGIARNAGRESA
jgi:hypothetical protein